MRLQRRIHLEQRKTHVDLQKEIRKRKEIEREIPAEDLEIIYVEREREREVWCRVRERSDSAGF